MLSVLLGKGGGAAMLCITMRKGDYFKIGGDITIRFDHLNSERVHLSIDAPREVPIVRGKVLERLNDADGA